MGLALGGSGITIAAYEREPWCTAVTLIGRTAHAAWLALVLLLGVAPVVHAKHWRDQGRDEEQGQAQRGRQNDYAPRDYAEPRADPQRAPGMSLDSAVAQARREGRVLSADVVDDGNGSAYRIKVLTPDGRVRVLYFSGGGR